MSSMISVHRVNRIRAATANADDPTHWVELKFESPYSDEVEVTIYFNTLGDMAEDHKIAARFAQAINAIDWSIGPEAPVQETYS